LESRVTLPDMFSGPGGVNLEDLIDYVICNRNIVHAQYVLLYFSRTNIVNGDDRYNLPNRIAAACDFVLIDFDSEQIIYGDTVDTNGHLFELVNLNETTIVNESIKALKHLFSNNTNQNIGIMVKNVFDGL
jgi:hypothetical protein